MAYQVLARKYRPQTFQEVIGQEPVIRALTNALAEDRTAHAYLFSGIRGVGKTTTARLLAKALNCEKGPTAEPCNECSSCTEITRGGALDVIEFDAATYTQVDRIREVLDSLRYSPARDRFKVYIVDEVHMLSKGAFNALLKTLEEPPAHVVFVLATTERRKVPATIVSRCQHFEFRPVPHPDLVGHLSEVCGREGAHVSAGAVSLIARRASGSVRDAQSLLDLVLCYGGEKVEESDAAQILGIADTRALSALLQAVGEGDSAAVLGRLDDLLGAGADPVQLHQGLVEHVRNLLVARTVSEPARLLAAADEEVAEWKEIGSRFEEAELLRLLRLLAKGEAEVRYASQPRYLLEGLLVRCCLLDRLQDLEEVLRGLEAGPEEPRVEDGPPGRSSAPKKAAAPGKRPEGRARQSSGASRGGGGGSLSARLAEAVGRASLRRWIAQARASVEGACLVLEVPSDNEHLADHLTSKSARQAILEAARKVHEGAVSDMQVRAGSDAGAAPPVPPDGETPQAPPGPVAQSPGGDLLESTPALKTLVEVFDGEITTEKEGQSRTRAGDGDRRLNAT